jgi:hypothetical protein
MQNVPGEVMAVVVAIRPVGGVVLVAARAAVAAAAELTP